MRVLFAMARPGHVRGFAGVITELATRRHEVTVVLDDATGRGRPELEQLVAGLRGVTLLERGERDRSGGEAARRARLAADVLRAHDPRSGTGPAVRARAGRSAPAPLRVLARRAALRRSAHWVFAQAARRLPADRATARLVAATDPAVVVITPLLEPGSRQAEYVCAARSRAVPSVMALASWDNLTTKGTLHVVPDVVAVWNEAHVREAVELHGLHPDQLRTTGSPPYDTWFAPAGPPRAGARRELGLDPDRPYVLYVGSSPFIAPQEGAFVCEWLRALRVHERLRQVPVVVRPHPDNPITGVAGDRHLHLMAPDDPLGTAARERYQDIVRHSAVVVGINTSALVEAAVAGRPVRSVTVERYAATQAAMPHFRHLLPERGGPLRLDQDLSAHAAALATIIAAPAAADPAALGFTRRFIRPRGIDVPASSVLVDVIEAAARTGAR